MSKRAEEVALKAYPVDICGYTVECRIGAKPQPQDWNEIRRTHFQEGYEQAEKDLALTWEDIKTITEIADSMLTGTAWDVIDWPDEQKYYEEVLKRYLEAKR